MIPIFNPALRIRMVCTNGAGSWQKIQEKTRSLVNSWNVKPGLTLSDIYKDLDALGAKYGLGVKRSYRELRLALNHEPQIDLSLVLEVK